MIIRPEQGRTARMDRELAEKLQTYKESLSAEEVEKLVRDTKELEAYQEEESAPEDLAKIPVLKRSDGEDSGAEALRHFPGDRSGL